MHEEEEIITTDIEIEVIMFLEFQYQMNDGWVKSVDEERDFGVLMSKNLKFSKQYLLKKNKANLMLCLINSEVSFKSAEVISKLYKSCVRPHLEYCVQFLSPKNAKDAGKSN